MKPQNNKSQLRLAMRRRILVKFTRPFERCSVNGYVLAVGPEFFMVAAVRDAAAFNGYQCFRIRDVRHLRVPDEHADFVTAALRARGQRLPRKPRISASSLPALLKSAGKVFPLITIYREAIEAGACWIGKVAKVDQSTVRLVEIQPGARWDDRANDYRLRDITQVNFGGEYEDALHVVGGEPDSSFFQAARRS